MNRNTIARSLVRRIRLLVVATLLGMLVNISAPPPVVHALALRVDTADDDPMLDGCDYLTIGDCSLRGAITKANNNAGLDTITFPPRLMGHPLS